MEKDWTAVREEMNERGLAILSTGISGKQGDELISNYENPNSYHKAITVERYRFGLGEYKYFNYPLPGLIQTRSENAYAPLSFIANDRMKGLNTGRLFPRTFSEFQTLCHAHKQTKPTVLILKYGQEGHNRIHQDLCGDIFFPIQLVVLLNEPGEDDTGCELILAQQTPRAQAKAIVLAPRNGDMLLFPTNFRLVKGTRGCYRVTMKHGVSEIREGERHTVGIIFHDAIS